MRIAILGSLAVLAGCIAPPHELTATSYATLPQPKSQVIVAGTLDDAQRILVELLASRGFPLVDRRPVTDGIWLKFGGNRDFAGYDTIGSVFYAWIHPVAASAGARVGTRVEMVGKPTLDHVESCPAMDGQPCTPVMTYQQWGVTGAEEATVIHGVFSELAMDGAVPPASSQSTATATR